MNSSSTFGFGGNFNSGYSNSNPNNPDFSFNAPSLQRSSSDIIPRPKLVKNRKQLNSHNLKSPGNLEKRAGSSFNLSRHRRRSPSIGNEDESIFSNLSNDITKLNIENILKGYDNVGSFIGRYKETEKIRNESRIKSNMKGYDEVDDGGKKDFLFKAGKGSDSSVQSSTKGIKNLNIKGFGDSNNKDNEGFGGRRDKELSAEMGSKLNIGSGMGDSAGKLGDKKLHEFTFQATTSKVHMDQPKTDIKPGGASFSLFQSCSKTSGETPDKAGKKDEFCFTAKQDAIGVPFVEFKTPNSGTNRAFGSSGKLEFSAKRVPGTSTRVRKKKGKLKQPKLVQLWHDPYFVSSKTDSLFSSREPSVTSDDCFSDSQPSVSHYAIGKEGYGNVFGKGVAAEDSSAETETETGSRTSLDRQDSDGLMYFSSPCRSERRSGFDFTFAASSSPQSQHSSPNRLKKKNSAKFASLHLTPRQDLETDFYTMQSKVGRDSVGDKGPEGKREPKSTGSSTAATESCEKWRLRGNQAYANGDLSKAEEYYMQGISCIPTGEKSRSCLRALMLCYSNLAATRMSLGRMRDALGDCMMAISIDPNFLRVQLRAANCYLALGEVEDAMRYFRKCLQSGTDVCVDRKVAVEASDGLQKAQKLSECMRQSALLLQSKTSDDAETALEVIAEALQISLYSEQFLEMKAEALLILGKYEDVIQLCVQTFDSAEKNSLSLDINGQPADPDSPGIIKDSTFRIWRCHLIFKSYFHLGKLEEAIAFLEKQEELQSVTDSDGSNSLESSIPLVATVRELLTHKAVGNEAFQSGRHLEAVEHYTAALSFNVESRPFAAICFCNRAAAYKALGQVTDAIADCSLAIALDGSYLKAISRRATLYEKIRDYGKATRDLERLLSLLMKQMEKKTSKTGLSERSMNLAKDSRQARSWLSEIEEECKKEVPLDFYLILGVEPSVSTAEIKKAYRKAALRHHPDKVVQSLVRTENGDDKIWKDIREEAYKDADKLFKIIGEAYAVLSDTNKRSRYDSEAETRNVQKKHSGRTPRAVADAQSYPFGKSGGSRSWKEAKGSYGYMSAKATQSNRFF